MNRLAKSVRIVEVGPRDGLQNESIQLDVKAKIALIEALVDCGLQEVESGAFVSPKWVAQMADSDAVLKGLKRQKGVRYPVLVPNVYGYEKAKAAGARTIAVLMSASERFSQKNINCSIEQALSNVQAIVALAKQDNIQVRGYLSCTLDCPYQGTIPPERTAYYALKLHNLGIKEISLGDTIGTATPKRVEQMLRAVLAHLPVEQVAVHFHDTYGQALTNAYVALNMGITTFDSAIAGLGGCPYAKGASGNLATEDLIYMLDGLGIDTGVNLQALCQISANLAKQYNFSIRSKTALAMHANLAEGD